MQITPSIRALRPARWLSLPRLIPVLAMVLAAASFLAGGARAAELQRALAATLVVYSDDRDEAFLGSAFLWEDGTIAVTNAHVVGDARSVELRSADGRRVSAPVIARDPGRDIALIAVEGAVFGPGLVAAPAVPAPGEPVYALGAPMGAEFTVTQGMVSAVGRQVEAASPIRFLQHDAAVNPGSSGGPLVDAQGRLVGMNSLIADGSRHYIGIAYAMTSEDVLRIVPALRDGTLRPVPDLGMRLRPVSRRIAEALGVPETGLLIDQVDPSGAAGRAGVLPGDIVVALDGGAIAAAGDLALLLDIRASETPRLTVHRGGREVTLVLDLSPASPVLARFTAATASGPAVIASYSFATLGIDLDGIEVRGLTPGSPADYGGLAAGDRILSVNGHPATPASLAGYEVNGPLVLLIGRPDGDTVHVVIDPWSRGRGPRPVGGANVLDPAVVLF